MRSYSPADWAPFFTALISAAAALTGLLFVAVSINLDRILKGGRFLPARAAETLAVLLLVVIGSAVTLIPQDARLIGISLTAHWGGGFYWLAAAALLGIIGAVYGAWVLLVEIVR